MSAHNDVGAVVLLRTARDRRIWLGRLAPFTEFSE
jgi:hypothetical protein